MEVEVEVDETSPSIVAALPDDVIIHILKRAPVRTIIKCTVLSKHWYGMIKETKTFPSNSTEAQEAASWYYLLFKQPRESISELAVYHQKKEEFKVMSTGLCLKHINSTTDIIGYRQQTIVVGEANGIVCLASEPTTLVDPVAGMSSELPPLKPKYIKYNTVVALGYIESLDQYRLIRVVFREGYRGPRRSLLLRFRIGISSKWEFTHVLGPDCSEIMYQGIGIAGNIFFVDILGSIKAYHLESEKFTPILPPPINMELHMGLHLLHSVTLGRRGNELTVMQVHFPSHTTNLWVKIRNVWITYRISFTSRPSSLVAMFNTSAIWWRVEEGKGLVLKDLRTAKSKAKLDDNELDIECIESKVIKLYDNELDIECIQHTPPYLRAGSNRLRL